MSDFIDIKRQTRIALPEDDNYIYRLGVALYGFASINSFMIEIICHIDCNEDQTSLSNKMSGKILEIFRKKLTAMKAEGQFPEIYETMENTADLFQKLNLQRSDFVHSYPITNKDNQQILHRRKDVDNKYFQVDNDFLDEFIGELEVVSDGLYKIRAVVQQKL